ncbi:MAG: DNA mismatch repair endonuclease MutL [Lachnospiraceae bacterium]|jgi:DNA mismatch repair protein MutL|nr:DNA mismatch repair endonuclease MutL [Lachnospiraceae bacterium]
MNERQTHKIAVLNKDTIDKIAAGEVVERPSSVVKELVENAIDAGASAVTVEIKEGGISFLRITDNGTGIERDEIPVAFLRHATSKIEKAEDLEEISSLGFRGEALSSIAAVARVELISKTFDSMTGTRYVIEGGEERSIEDVGAPEGTTIIVQDLFYNVPARKKFLKTATTEAGYISSLMEQMALSHPEVSIKYMANGQLKLHTTGNDQLKDVIYKIYGRDITRQLLPITWENDLLKITGYLGTPAVSRGNRGFENYFINGRAVKDKIITRGLEDGFHGYMMQHKYPFAVLQMEMDGNGLDVNVHPSKLEVRFSRGEEVYQAVHDAVRETLGGQELIPEVTLEKKRENKKKTSPPPGKKESVPEPFETKRRIQAGTKEAGPGSRPEGRRPVSYEQIAAPSPQSQTIREESPWPSDPAAAHGSAGSASQGRKIPEPAGPRPLYTGQESQAPVSQGQARQVSAGQDTREPDTAAQEQGRADPQPQPLPEGGQMGLFTKDLLTEEARSRHILIGQVFRTYWLVEYEERFFIIDQHAAHEKVLYERLRKSFREKQVSSQYLDPPLVLTVDIKEELLLLEHMRMFQKMGFEIEPFGPREYSVHAVPTDLYGMTGETLFKELLDSLEREKTGQDLEVFTDRLATMACKAAVKGNQGLSHREADQLIDELLTLENPYHCPHGRPTIISMSRTELERKFKRII